MELDMKKILDFKAVTFGIWGLKTSLRQFGPKKGASTKSFCTFSTFKLVKLNMETH